MSFLALQFPVSPERRVTSFACTKEVNKTSNPANSWLTTPCFHFDFQGVVSGSAGPYVLTIEGSVDPSPLYTPSWTLEAGAGTLTNATTTTPTHTAPAAEGDGKSVLTGMKGSTAASCTAEKEIKIYADHLARDRENFGTHISCYGPWSFTRLGATINMPTTWNCFGSVDHIYNGSGTGYVNSVNIPNGWSKTTFDIPISSSNWTSIESSLKRGDVVSFWSGSSAGFNAQHAHTCLSGTTMYGANNEPVITNGLHPAIWRWFETTSQNYFNGVNTAPRTRDLLSRVVVHKKP